MSLDVAFCVSTTAEYSHLYYHCHRILADMFNSDEVRRTLSLSKRLVVLGNVSRHVAPRPVAVYSGRSRLHMLPAFLYNAAPESEIIHELKDKVWAFGVMMLFVG